MDNEEIANSAPNNADGLNTVPLDVSSQQSIAEDDVSSVEVDFAVLNVVSDMLEKVEDIQPDQAEQEQVIVFDKKAIEEVEKILNEPVDRSLEPFVPHSDMKSYDYGLCNDQKIESVAIRKQMAQNNRFGWNFRLREAAMCGDNTVFDSVLTAYSAAMQAKSGETHDKCVVACIQQLLIELTDATPFIHNLSWDRPWMNCCNAFDHYWCTKLEFVVKVGVNVNMKCGVSQWTPLHVAANKGSVCQVAKLLMLGADSSSLDNTGQTPLHLAVKRGHKLIASMLVRHGSDVNAVSDNLTPLQLANRCFPRNYQLVEWLTNKTAMLNTVFKFWEQHMEFVTIHQALGPPHMWPVFACDAKKCRRIITLDIESLAFQTLGMKCLVMLGIRFLNENGDLETPLFNNKTLKVESSLTDLMLSVNNYKQTVTNVNDQGWLSTLEPLIKGKNNVNIHYTRMETTGSAFTSAKRRCVLVAQPWLCSRFVLDNA